MSHDGFAFVYVLLSRVLGILFMFLHPVCHEILFSHTSNFPSHSLVFLSLSLPYALLFLLLNYNLPWF